ncbi:MAG: hypothetical protein ABI434_08340, partial [Burkholderiaceae bacterium]
MIAVFAQPAVMGKQAGIHRRRTFPTGAPLVTEIWGATETGMAEHARVVVIGGGVVGCSCL